MSLKATKFASFAMAGLSFVFGCWLFIGSHHFSLWLSVFASCLGFVACAFRAMWIEKQSRGGE